MVLINLHLKIVNAVYSRINALIWHFKLISMNEKHKQQSNIVDDNNVDERGTKHQVLKFKQFDLIQHYIYFGKKSHLEKIYFSIKIRCSWDSCIRSTAATRAAWKMQIQLLKYSNFLSRFNLVIRVL